MKKEKKILWVTGVLTISMIICCIFYSIDKGFKSAGIALVLLSITTGMYISKFCNDIDEINDTKRKERLLNELLKDEKP